MLSQVPPQLSPNWMCSFSLFRILWVHLVQPVVYSEPFRGHIPEENLVSLPSGHQLSIASQLWVGTLWVPLQSAGILVWLTLCRSSACSHSSQYLHLYTSAAVSSCLQWPYHVQQILFLGRHPLLLALMVFLLPLSLWSLNIGGRGYEWYRCSI